MNPAYEKAHNILAMAYEEAVWKDPTTLRSVVEFEEDLDKFFSLEDDKTGFGSGWQKLVEEETTQLRHTNDDLASVGQGEEVTKA